MKLLIPDGHVEPNQDLTRFTLAGRMLVDRQPNHVIFLGDFGSFNSLNHWNHGRPRQMEGERYQADIDACKAALELFFAPLEEYNLKQKRTKGRQYHPTCTFIEGNHEYWITKQVDAYPQMEGFLDLQKNLGLDKWFQNFVPYKQGIEIDGVTYTHAPLNRAGQPLSGMHITHKASMRYKNSAVFGHYHRWESFSDRYCDSDVSRRFLSAGCFFGEVPGYIAGTTANPAEWSGLTLIKTVPGDVFETEQVSIKTLEQLYHV